VETKLAVGASASTGRENGGPAEIDHESSPLYNFLSANTQEDGAPADSVDFIPALFEAAPDSQIIVLTGSTDSQLHRRVVAQGAKGLLQKDCSPEVLMRAIECVYTGEVWIERTMMASVLAEIAQTGGSGAVSRPPTPTAREREVIVLLCEGLPNRQIAARLCISETTVRRHLTTIFSKLGVADRLELVIFAYRHGLAGLPE
jgi:DNA-binding NarL/FixJ family response regulator